MPWVRGTIRTSEERWMFFDAFLCEQYHFLDLYSLHTKTQENDICSPTKTAIIEPFRSPKTVPPKHLRQVNIIALQQKLQTPNPKI